MMATASFADMRFVLALYIPFDGLFLNRIELIYSWNRVGSGRQLSTFRAWRGVLSKAQWSHQFEQAVGFAIVFK